VARGGGTATIEPGARVDLSLMLEPDDFVVNASIAGTQALTFLPGRNGRQEATASDGSFTVAFVNDCAMLGRCDVFARRFNPDTTPAQNDVTQDEDEFIVNQVNQFGQVPSVSIGDGGMLFTWSTETEIRSAPMTATAGFKKASDVLISDDTTTSRDAHSAALATGDYVVVWTEDVVGGVEVRGRLLDRDGNPIVNPITGDNGAFVINQVLDLAIELPSVTATGDGRGFVVAWNDNDNILARFFDSDAMPVTPAEVTLTPYGTEVAVYGPQVAWAGDSVAVVWGTFSFDIPKHRNGALFAQRFAQNGDPVSTEAALSLATANEFGAPALARRADGAIAAAWHDCEDRGDGDGCGVFVQIMLPSGLRVGDPIVVASTTAGDQTAPAIAALDDAFVVVWTDQSETAPDTSEGAVRGRVIYPPYEVANGERGAPCGGEGAAACGDGLVCIGDGAGTARCHDACDTADAEACAFGGVCTQEGESAGCRF
jgi:hypothetical protein